jgi:hypothetical protein
VEEDLSLTLEGRRFDSKRVYQLILRDAETGVEEARSTSPSTWPSSMTSDP